MKSYAALRDELARPIQQTVENLRRDLEAASREVVAREAERDSVRESVQGFHERRRALQAPRDAVGREIAERQSRITDLRRQVADLEREIEHRHAMLEQYGREDQEIDAEVQRHRSRIAALDREAKQAREREGVVRAELEAAQERITDCHVRALRGYLDDLFNFFRQYSAQAGARSKWESTRSQYEEARHREPDLMRMHEERQQLGHLLAATTVPTLRDLLEDRGRGIEQALELRFPGLLTPPPERDPDQTFETYYWYNADDDLTYLLLPVPSSCWHTPPESVSDPRGAILCRVLWAFTQAVADASPSVDCLSEQFVVLEFHGDSREVISQWPIELEVAATRVVGIVPVPLPTELMERIA